MDVNAKIAVHIHISLWIVPNRSTSVFLTFRSFVNLLLHLDHSVDAGDLVSEPHATEMIFDFAIAAFHFDSLDTRNFGSKSPILQSASSSRTIWPRYVMRL